MTNDQLLKDYESAAKVAAMDLEAVPLRTRGGWTARVAEAKAKVKALKLAYNNALLSGAVGIILDGDPEKISQAVKLMNEDGVVIDGQALYKRIADQLAPTFGNTREWGIAQTHKLHLLLQEIMHELGLTEIPMSDRHTNVTCQTYNDIVIHVRNTLFLSLGTTLTSLYLDKLATERAFALHYTGTNMPVVIYNVYPGEEDRLGSRFGRGHTIWTLNAEDNVNPEYLSKNLKNLAKKLLNKK